MDDRRDKDVSLSSGWGNRWYSRAQKNSLEENVFTVLRDGYKKSARKSMTIL